MTRCSHWKTCRHAACIRSRPLHPGRPSRNRNGARWVLYGLPGGYLTAAPAGTPLNDWQARCALPLLTFRTATADRYDLAAIPRLDYARGWALYVYGSAV